MSNTVKTVMTVTMIGLVALLGAKAEAHVRYIDNRAYKCMTCGDAHLEEVPPADLRNPITPAPTLVAELIVQAKTAKIMCKDGTIDLKKKDGVMTLISEVPSNLWTDYRDGIASVHFETVPELFEILGFCGGEVTDARIFKMDATYNVYETFKTDKISNRILLDTVQFTNCKVGPNALPGTEYICDPINPNSQGHHPTPPPTK